MNLNNKNLAIGLSVAAVLIVSYQLFFNKNDTRPKRQAAHHQPAIPPAGERPDPSSPAAQTMSSNPSPDPNTPTTPPPAAQSTEHVQGDGSSGPVIDFNSPILLKRIPAEMVVDRPRMEIPQGFGMNIFSGNQAGESEKINQSGKKENIKIVQFTLNAIVIDQDRKLTIINNTILKVGDIVQGAEVVSIIKSKVLLKVNKKTVVLSTNSRVKQVRLLEGKGE